MRLAGSSVPHGAVKIYNVQSSRAGFFSYSKGSFCYYPKNGQECSEQMFEFLVNENDFEVFEWRQSSYGLVPKHSVRTCQDEQIYVGKNKHSLGMVIPKDNAFYLPWEGSEYCYAIAYEPVMEAIPKPGGGHLG